MSSDLRPSYVNMLIYQLGRRTKSDLALIVICYLYLGNKFKREIERIVLRLVKLNPNSKDDFDAILDEVVEESKKLALRVKVDKDLIPDLPIDVSTEELQAEVGVRLAVMILTCLGTVFTKAATH